MAMKTLVLGTALAASAAGAALLSPGEATPGEPVTERRCDPVLGVEVCTWVVLDGDRVTELGASIPMALVEAVPLEAEMVWPPEQLGAVTLPDGAREALGLDHLGINWEANGHPPATYLAQHFDFHFYAASRDEVQAIDCTDSTKPAHLPDGYALPDFDIPGLGPIVGLCVPGMGMHAMTEHEVHETAPFEASMMLGYYGGTPLFFEPMVSRETLLRRADFTLPMPEVGELPDGVVYPTSFRAEYDSEHDQYRLVMGGFDQG